MAPFADSGEVERALEALAGRADAPVVRRLPRQPGRREARYVQLLTGEPSAELTAEPAAPAAIAAPTLPADSVDLLRLERLEEEVRKLRAELDELRSR